MLYLVGSGVLGQGNFSPKKKDAVDAVDARAERARPWWRVRLDDGVAACCSGQHARGRRHVGQFIAAAGGSGTSMEYLTRLRRPDGWGDSMSLAAICRAAGLSVWVLTVSEKGARAVPGGRGGVDPGLPDAAASSGSMVTAQQEHFNAPASQSSSPAVADPPVVQGAAAVRKPWSVVELAGAQADRRASYWEVATAEQAAKRVDVFLEFF